MNDLFKRLEHKIKNLVQQHEALKNANQKLKQSKSILISEKEQLLVRHKTAVSHIENMVHRLKKIENPS